MVKDIVLLLIVIAGLVSFFYNPTGSADIKYLQILMGGIVGFYTGIKEVPLSAQITKLLKK